ncbi:MAG: hypothetical protein ACRDQ2_18765, partial [Gaiellales bacterium]
MGASPLIAGSGPIVTSTSVTFRLEDPDGVFDAVRLHQEIERPRSGPAFVRSDSGWTLAWKRPAADRIEYMFEVRGRDGSAALIADPANPLGADGPFGMKSVVEFAGYEPPKWLDETPAQAGSIEPLAITSRVARQRIAAQIWSAPGLDIDAPAPLLVVHDGPEYALYSGLTWYFDFLVGNTHVPPFRAALLPPENRNQIYSASARYARAFAHDILPAVVTACPTPHGRRARVGMGASLGALAMMHIHRTAPETLGALFLQAGSFFRQRYDPQ